MIFPIDNTNIKVYNGTTKHDVHVKQIYCQADLLYLTTKVLLLIVRVAHLKVKRQLSLIRNTKPHFL